MCCCMRSCLCMCVCVRACVFVGILCTYFIIIFPHLYIFPCKRARICLLLPCQSNTMQGTLHCIPTCLFNYKIFCIPRANIPCIPRQLTPIYLPDPKKCHFLSLSLSVSLSLSQKLSRSASNGTLHERYSYCKGTYVRNTVRCSFSSYQSIHT